MKKILLLMAVCTTAISMSAQGVSDAVIFSEDNTTGTARFRAMSGAFGALGGDFSAIGINPAGSAVFLRSSGAISLSGYNSINDSFYGDGIASNEDASGSLNQIGGVFVFNNTSENSAFKNVTLAINYDQTQNLDDEYFAFGQTQRSIDQYFLEFAQGVPLELLEPGVFTNGTNETLSERYAFLGETEGFGVQQAFLGFQAFVINPESDDPNNTAYTSNVAPGNFLQDYAFISNGTNGKFSFNVGTQLNNGLHLGLNLNSHFIDYQRQTILFETNTNGGSGVNEIYFENNLRTTGSGFSAQVGAIYKVNEQVRLGFAFDTPTYYNISEETTQALNTFSNAQNRETFVEPNVINIFPEYELRTPGNISVSAAYLFGQQGLISLDYSYRDHSSTEYDSNFGNEFDALNNAITNNLKGASTIRLGGEYRIEQWSLRGGYRFTESPYEDEITLGSLTGYSLGLGYNFGKIKLDFAYDIYEQDRAPRLYDVGQPPSAQLQRPLIDRINSSFTATLSFGL